MCKEDNGYVQHPAETAVQLCVYTLQVRDGHLLAEDHLVERRDEVRIEETTVEDTETQAAADKLEVVQVLGVDTGCRVDLERVVVVGGVLEETVKGVEHLMRQQEEELPVRIVRCSICDNDTEMHTWTDHRNRDRPRPRT